MLRRTLTKLRVSPYSVFLKDLARKKELAGMTVQEGAKVASRMYRALSGAKLKSLQTRAAKMNYPALNAFNQFQRKHAHKYKHLNNKQRQRVVAKMWHMSKGKGKSVAVKPVKARVVRLAKGPTKKLRLKKRKIAVVGKKKVKVAAQ